MKFSRDQKGCHVGGLLVSFVLIFLAYPSHAGILDKTGLAQKLEANPAVQGAIASVTKGDTTCEKIRVKGLQNITKDFEHTEFLAHIDCTAPPDAEGDGGGIVVMIDISGEILSDVIYLRKIGFVYSD